MPRLPHTTRRSRVSDGEDSTRGTSNGRTMHSVGTHHATAQDQGIDGYCLVEVSSKAQWSRQATGCEDETVAFRRTIARREMLRRAGKPVVQRHLPVACGMCTIHAPHVRDHEHLLAAHSRHTPAAWLALATVEQGSGPAVARRSAFQSRPPVCTRALAVPSGVHPDRGVISLPSDAAQREGAKIENLKPSNIQSLRTSGEACLLLGKLGEYSDKADLIIRNGAEDSTHRKTTWLILLPGKSPFFLGNDSISISIVERDNRSACRGRKIPYRRDYEHDH